MEPERMTNKANTNQSTMVLQNQEMKSDFSGAINYFQNQSKIIKS
jgi:hypothetical protein